MISARVPYWVVTFVVPAMTVSSCWIARLAVLFDIQAADFNILINSKQFSSNERKEINGTSRRP